MDKEQRLDLFMQMRKKGLKQNQVAAFLGLSCSAVSQYFSKDGNAISDEKAQKLIEYIEQY